jgi:predicted nucleic acid-binding protein
LIVVDSSAWVELFRATGTPVHRRLHMAVADREPLAVTELVVGVLLAAVVSRRELANVRRMLLSFPVLPLGGLAGFEEAAQLARACRLAGETLRRGLGDCLVAVPAIRAGAAVLQRDRDFDVLARHTELRLVELG